MLLAEINSRSINRAFESEDRGESGLCHEQVADPTFDFESWDLLSCWKQQQADRFGAGNSAPTIPNSQRQYDGENFFEFCEQLSVR